MATNNAINLSAAGYTVYDGAGTFSGRTFQAGTGISLTNASGTAGNTTINALGAGLTWSVITASQNAVAGNGYFCNKAGVLILTLPTVTVIGQVIAAVNVNTAADTQILSANPGQIQLGSSLCTANTGTLTSTALGDAIFLVAYTTTSSWYCFGVQGNWSIV